MNKNVVFISGLKFATTFAKILPKNGLFGPMFGLKFCQNLVNKFCKYKVHNFAKKITKNLATNLV